MITSKEEIKINEFSIKNNLRSKGIDVLEESFRCKKELDRQDIKDQVNLIVDVHKIIAGCRFEGFTRIRSIIGKELEEYKTMLRKLQKNYEFLSSCGLENNMEKAILCEGKMLLNQGREAISYIESHGYIPIIERSMNREEICIGRCDESNLRKSNGRIEISTIKRLTYNIIEEDLYKYIKKIQRKQVDFNVEDMVKQYVYGSHLSRDSIHYLNGLLSYPRDSIRIWYKYIENKNEKDTEEVLRQFKKSISYEGEKVYY